jgi:hypothetical protein
MNDPNLLYVPLKLVAYWLGIFVVFHVVGSRVGGDDPPRLRTSFLSAGGRFLMGLVYAIPLSLVTIRMGPTVIFTVFLVARLTAWGVALIPYYRRDAARAIVFAVVMTALNFVLDYFVVGDWLASGLANFRMC